MNDSPDPLAERLGRLTPDRLAVLVRGLQDRIDALRLRAEAPVAVIGLALRLPGASNPGAFWDLISDGTVAIREVPPDRWDAGKLLPEAVPPFGGFIDDIDQFDAGFFRIPPVEAAAMDPQQRLAAEVAWEALETAGYALAERRPVTGVFLGASTDDYKTRFLMADPAGINPRMATGTANSLIAGRLSYMFDLNGPSLVVDTACSSSLVATHLACRSLRAGECGMALAGGVGLLIEPDLTVAFSRLGMLSPRGRCSTFTADADGYVRGEGAAMLVLRRLADAERDGDAVLAVIRGSAVNQDGRSNGLTAPNGSAQRAVVAAALSDAGLPPAAIDAVECHGTATPLGDPIEVEALADAYAADRAPERPLLLGSVKANIGHLEAAAGVAGLAKAVLCLMHRTLPRQPTMGPLNRRIDWAALPVHVADKTARLAPTEARPARIGVSSFGFSGTNAHLILEEAVPQPRPVPDGAAAPFLIAISASSAASLSGLASATGTELRRAKSDRPAITDLARNLVLRRRPRDWRCAAAGTDAATIADALTRAADTARPIKGPARLAFLFTGQGSHWAGMGQALHAQEPAFRKAFNECADLLRPLLDVALPDLLWGPQAEALLRQTGYAQPALFSLQHALVRLWAHWGVRPDVLLGHSIGEYAAACAVGVMELPDALGLVAARGRLMQSLPDGGGMVTADVAEAEAEALLAQHPMLDLAAVNATGSVVLSGPVPALEAFASARPVGSTRRLVVSHAFHSRAMEPILDAFAGAVAQVQLRPANKELISSVTGQAGSEAWAEPAYWRRQLREPVRFAAAAGRLQAEVAVEIGPRPVLLGLLPADGPMKRLPSMRPEDITGTAVLHALGGVFTAGHNVDWAALHANRGGRQGPAPATPFDRQRYWTARTGEMTRTTTSASANPGKGMDSPEPEHRPAGQLAKPGGETVRDALQAILADAMQLATTAIAPDAAFVEMGADSLILMQVAARIEQRFGVKVPRRDLFGSLNTLAALEAFVGQAQTFNDQVTNGQGNLGNMPAADTATEETAAVSRDTAADVAALSARLRGRTRGSWGNREANAAILADSRGSAGYRPAVQSLIYPLVGDRADGARIWDVDGNPYVDITMGFGVQLFGHAAPFITRALQAQLAKGLQLGPQARLAGEAAQLLHRLTGVDRVAFCNTGTEAVMTALRLARATTGRNGVALFQGSYHGHFDGVLANAGAGASSSGNAEPLSPGTPPGFTQDLLVLDYADQAASMEALERHRSRLAAVLVEPIQSRRPGLQPRAFLHALRDWTRRAGVALIFDEVLLGFRIAQGGAQEWAGVEADLVTYGKIIGGGLPIGVVGGRRDFMDRLDGGGWMPGSSGPMPGAVFFAGTFNKNPLTMAASVAVLRQLEQEGSQLQNRLNQRTAELVTRLNDVFAQRTNAYRVDSAGSLFRFIGVPDLFYYHLLARGVYVWEGRTCFLSTAHTDSDLEFIVDAVQETAAALSSGAVAPAAPGIAPSAPLTAPPLAGDRLPLTASQHALWLRCQMSETISAAYNQSMRVRFSIPPDRQGLERALLALVGRHASLRVRFQPDGKSARIAAELDLPLVDVPDGPDAERAFCWQPFDLEAGPVLRAGLQQDGAQVHLILVLPHLVTDGWSLAVMADELGTLYRAETGRTAAALPPAPSPMVYAAAVSRREADPAVASAWLDRFSPPPPILNLPTTRPRPRVQSHEGARVVRELGTGLVARLRAFCRQYGVSLVATGLAIYANMLGRIGRTEDVVIGLLSAGQPVHGVPCLVGYCAAMLPVRISLAGTASLAALSAACHAEIDAALDRRDYSLAALVQALGLPRDPSRPPLMSVGFNCDRRDAPADFGMPVTIEGNVHGAVRWDLFLNLIVHGDAITLELDYPTALFDVGQVEAWADHYVALIDRLTAAPNAPFALPDLTTCVAEHALHRSEAIAVEDGTIALTYAELWREAGHLAKRLRQAGAVPGCIVAADLGRSAMMMVAMLGCWRAGAVFLPLEDTHPHEYRRALVADAKATCLIRLPRQADGSGREPGWELPCLELRLGEAEPTADAFAPPDPTTAAYLVYTSGSTGRPKGILVSHRSIAAYVEAVLERLDITLEDIAGWRFALVSSFAADLGYTSIIAALAGGGILRIFQQVEMRDPAAFAAAMTGAPVDVVKIVPTHLAALLDWPAPAAMLPRRRLVLGGEAASWSLIERISCGAPACRVFNHYGPAETTIGATCVELTQRLREQSPDAVPLGYPLSHATLRVDPLDGAEDEDGEILIGGEGVAIGYLHADMAQDARFAEDPAEPLGTRVYRTGDRGRFLPNGMLLFLGRIDEEVKIRGHRVAPGAIAAMLRACPDVRDAVVTTEHHTGGDPRLVATVAAPPFLDEAALRRWAVAHLPPAMVPRTIRRVDSLPRTANGKVDRDALVLPVAAPPSDQAPASVSASAGTALLGLWREVLRMPEAGPEDDFFALGGDSITAIQLAGRARAIGIKFNAQAIFEHPTVATLLAAGGVTSFAGTMPDKAVVDADVPLAPVQRAFFDLAMPNPAHWCLSSVLWLPGRPAVEQIWQALRQVAQRHPALRTRFPAQDGQRTQQVMANPVLDDPMTVMEQGLDDGERLALEDSVASALMTGLDLEDGRLLGAALLERGEDEDSALLIAVHHLVFDAVSWRVLAEDLVAVLAGARLPAISGYDQWCSAIVRAEPGYASELGFWQAIERRILPLFPIATKPRDREGDAVRVVICLSSASTAALQQVAAAAGSGMHHAVLAALMSSLARFRAEPVVIDMEGHGREEIDPALDMAGMIGWFTAHFPVVLELDAAADPAAQIVAMRTQWRGVPSGGRGYGTLRFLRLDPGLGRDPEVSFNFLGKLDGETGPARFERFGVGVERDPAAPRRYPLLVEGFLASNSLTVELIHAPGRLASAIVRSIRDDMVAWFDRACAACNTATEEDPLAFNDDDMRMLQERLGL